MKKITLKYENIYNGKVDTYKKQIDVDFQSGNNQNSESLQVYNVMTSLAISLFDFTLKMGYEPSALFLHMEKLYSEMIEEDIEPEANLVPADDQLDYESFIEQFNKSEEFKQKLYNIFQMYMEDDD